MAAEDLPSEIIGEIVSFIHQDKDTLKNASAVSSVWHSETKRFTFGHVKFPEGPPGVRRVEALLDLIHSDESIARYVQSVSLTTECGQDYHALNALGKPLLQLVQTLENISYFSFVRHDQPDHESLSDSSLIGLSSWWNAHLNSDIRAALCHICSLPNLRSLCLFNPRIPFSIFAYNPGLDSLTYAHTLLNNDDEDQVVDDTRPFAPVQRAHLGDLHIVARMPQLFEKLTQLVVTIQSKDISVFHNLSKGLQACKDTLRDLVLSVFDCGVARTNLKFDCLEHLRSLSFTYRSADFIDRASNHVTSLGGMTLALISLGSWKYLERLELHTSANRCMDDPQNPLLLPGSHPTWDVKPFWRVIDDVLTKAPSVLREVKIRVDTGPCVGCMKDYLELSRAPEIIPRFYKRRASDDADHPVKIDFCYKTLDNVRPDVRFGVEIADAPQALAT